MGGPFLGKNYIDSAKGITPPFSVKKTEGERWDTDRVSGGRGWYPLVVGGTTLPNKVIPMPHYVNVDNYVVN